MDFHADACDEVGHWSREFTDTKPLSLVPRGIGYECSDDEYDKEKTKQRVEYPKVEADQRVGPPPNHWILGMRLQSFSSIDDRDRRANEGETGKQPGN